MRRLLNSMIFLVIMMDIFTFPIASYADEISEQIKEGLEFYEKGDFSEAVNSLNFAIGQIQQKQAGGLKDVFPPPLEGWKAEESEGSFGAAPFMGGGVSASRHYYVEDSEKMVDIEIVMDSPLLQSVMMFYTNPAFFASQPGTKLIKIQGRKAIQKFSEGGDGGEINIIIGSRMLVAIKGQGLKTPDDMVKYAEAIDYTALEKFLEK